MTVFDVVHEMLATSKVQTRMCSEGATISATRWEKGGLRMDRNREPTSQRSCRAGDDGFQRA